MRTGLIAICVLMIMAPVRRGRFYRESADNGVIFLRQVVMRRSLWLCGKLQGPRSLCFVSAKSHYNDRYD